MRMTNDHRNTIVKRALAKAFEKREAAQVKEEAALAAKAYNSIYPADLRKKVAAVPVEWFRTCQCMSFTINGQYHRLDAGKEMPTPYDSGCHNNGNLIGEIAEEVQAFDQSKEDLRKERLTAESKLTGMLSNISTFSKLETLWPEGKEFYADLDEDAKVKGGLPAIRFDDMNTILGITKKAA
jgi:hypothetical protein